MSDRQRIVDRIRATFPLNKNALELADWIERDEWLKPRMLDSALRAACPWCGGTGEECVNVPGQSACCYEPIAKLFHDAYETLAPEYGYKTRPESRCAWEGVPLVHRRLMCHVVRVVLLDVVRMPLLNIRRPSPRTGEIRTVLCRRMRSEFDGGLARSVVCLCPFCGQEHIHGVGPDPGPDYGVHIAHCQKADVPAKNGYRLVLE